MDIRGWDERYRTRARAAEDFSSEPAALVVKVASLLTPGCALDLACGSGRNALWLAAQGWDVTAVDGSAVAIEMLRESATQRSLTIRTAVADLESHQYAITPGAWDLIVICYYLQRELLEPAKRGLAPGGLLISIAHLTEPGEAPTAHRLNTGELKQFFAGWTVLHYREGQPKDPNHLRPVAEIVARRPAP